MKRISKDDAKRKDELGTQIARHENELQDAINKFNEAKREAWGPVQVAIEAYNDVIREVEGFCGDVWNEIDNYINERSEKWQESDAASAFGEWRDSWQEISGGEIELEEPEDVEIPESETADAFSNLENEVNL